ncbi:MAG: ABC transporter ATP-binding protein [bacterium]|nr:ABC transporter ATP-binding protein [bacterium]
MENNKPIHEETSAQGGWLDAFFRRILFAKDIVIPPPKGKNAQVQDVLLLYFESVRQFPVSALIALSGVSIASVIALIVPLYYKDFFDVLAQGGDPLGHIAKLRTIIFIILGFGVANFIIWRAMHFGMQYLAAKVMGDLRKRAFGYTIDHSHRFFASTFVGTLVQRINRFAHSYDRLADKVVYDIVPIIIQVTGVIWILTRKQPVMAAVIAGWTVLFIGFNYLFARWKLKYDIASAAQDSKTTGTLADIITNQPAVESHGSHDIEKARYGAEVGMQMLMNRFRWNLSQTVDAVQAALIVFVEFAIFWIGIELWVKGQFSIGTFVLVQAYIIRLSNQLWGFSRIVRDIYESFADAKEMAEIMLFPHEITESAHPTAIREVRGAIEFDHAAFHYQGEAGDGEAAINDFTATIKAGERVALVGPSGAGKSTIVKLLFRFFDPTSGAIKIDGVDIRDFPLATLRQQLSLVPQDPSLFHRSLTENIRYGRPGATDEEVFRAAHLAHCDEFIHALPARYETLVGERGIKLSGGERQRVALARAFVRNAPVIVLDEATSSLDSESERHIQQALGELMKGRTTIVIAHRLSTIRSMDRIIVMDKGRIIEDGSHDELLAKKGMYAKLWTLQQGGFIPSALE